MRLKDNFNDYLDFLRRKGLSEKTIREHRRFLLGSLSHSIQDIKIKNLKLNDVARIIEAGRRHGEFGPQRSVVVFRRYLKFLKEQGTKIPLDYRDIEVPKVPHKEPIVLSQDELLKFLDAFPINHSNIFAKRMALCMRTLCEVLFATGMRISEALSMQWQDFEDIRNKKELIIRGKGGSERTVYFSDRATGWIEKYLNIRNDGSGTMFVNSLGRPLLVVTAKSYILRFRKRFGKAGDKIRFHTFRRTLATVLIENGADIKSTQHILGHRSERTTLRYYVAINRKRAKDIHQKILNCIRG